MWMFSIYGKKIVYWGSKIFCKNGSSIYEIVKKNKFMLVFWMRDCIHITFRQYVAVIVLFYY